MVRKNFLKMTKVRKKWVFEKKSEIVRKFDKIKKKRSDFVSLSLQNSLFSKALSSKKINKNPLKSD